MHIGILECGKPPKRVVQNHGAYPEIFARLLQGRGFTFETFNADRCVLPASVQVCEGWLIPGSGHGVYETHAYLPLMEDFVRACFAESVPMVGVCFGHQLIAKALGGRVEKFSGGWSVGRHVYAFEQLGDVALNAWHQDQVLEAPKMARTVATSVFCHHAALCYGNRAWSIQAHPEYSPEILSDMITARRGRSTIPEFLLDTAEMTMGDPLNTELVIDKIAQFFLAEREPPGDREETTRPKVPGTDC